MSYRVLVVDDSDLNRKLVTTLLHANAFDVLQAEDAEHAIILAINELPDLILMDIQLPGMDGYEATRRLRETPETSNIPIIALTAHAMPADEQRAREAGCNGYISKPINTRNFVPQLRKYLEGQS